MTTFGTDVLKSGTEAGTRTAPEIGARVLIVDDEPATLKMTRSVLERAFYQVTSCSDGSEALRLINSGSFDCVITDAMMPIMDGYDLIRAIRHLPELTQLPVLMLTRKRNREDVKKAIDAGVTDYVLKPIDEQLLLEKVSLCLKKGGGRRQVFECPIDEPYNRAKLEMTCRVIAMSEADLTIRTNFALNSDTRFELKTKLFDEIGIVMPVFMIIQCNPTTDVIDQKEFPFESRLGFIGMVEQDLKKIRSWLQRQSLRRRK